MKWLAALCLLAVGATGCVFGSTETGNAADCIFAADAPADAVHVCPDAAPADADGTERRPFGSVAQALEARPSTEDLWLSAGDHDAFDLVGGVRNVTGAVGTRIRGRVGLVRGTFRLASVSIEGALGVGLQIEASTVRLEAISVRDVETTEGRLGYGVFASDSRVEALDVRVEGSDSVGVLLVGGTADLVSLTCADNGRGGLRAETSAQVVLRGGLFEDNRGAGILVLGGRVELASPATVVRGGASTTPTDDGVVVGAIEGGPPGSLLGEALEVEGVGRIGVLVDDARVELVRARLVGNAGGGLWAQRSSAQVDLAETELGSNGFVGVGATLGARLDLRDSTVRGTTLVDTRAGRIGDGVGVFEGATASISGNRIVDNARAGVLFDASSGLVSENIVRAPEIGVQLQSSADRVVETEGNDISEAGEAATVRRPAAGAELLPVPIGAFSVPLR